MVTDIERIGPREAKELLDEGALLVCAYADEEKCRQVALEGSISLAQLAARKPTLSKDTSLIFYCA
jgi:hypothetical protein